MSDLNRVCLIGRLTRDPELRNLPSGSSVASMRLAVNGYKSDGSDSVDYVDLSVFGAQGEACARLLHKGSRVSVDGRLRYSEWKAEDGSSRSKHEVVAQHIGFLDPKRSDGPEEHTSDSAPADTATADDDTPANSNGRERSSRPEPEPQPVGTPAAAGDEDIPF
jgi:single-strand DNA-binding protein